MYRDAMLEPEKLRYFAVTNGFGPKFEGVWKGKSEAIYAVGGTRRRFEGVHVGHITDAHIPYHRVDDVDTEGEPILVVLSTESPEHEMIRTLSTKRQIFDNGPVSNSHREMTYSQVVEKCRQDKLIDEDAPIFQKPEGY